MTMDKGGKSFDTSFCPFCRSKDLRLFSYSLDYDGIPIYIGQENYRSVFERMWKCYRCNAEISIRTTVKEYDILLLLEEDYKLWEEKQNTTKA